MLCLSLWFFHAHCTPLPRSTRNSTGPNPEIHHDNRTLRVDNTVPHTRQEAAGRRGLLNAAIQGLGLSHAFVQDNHLIVQHATTHANMIAEARQQAVRAIQVRAM